MTAKRPTRTYVAVVGIDADDRYEPGDDVPATLVKKAPWLLEQGKVVEAE